MIAGNYIKKPVGVQAVQFDGSNCKDVLAWVRGHAGPESCTHENGELFIATLEGVMKAQPGDYIIRGVRDEFYPCRADIFEETYDKVER